MSFVFFFLPGVWGGDEKAPLLVAQGSAQGTNSQLKVPSLRWFTQYIH